MKDILFVCTGNLCRSPLAEGYFAHRVSELNLSNLKWSSAGTHAMEGAVPPPETCETATANGFDVSGHQAQFLSFEMIQNADIICIMEMGHAPFITMIDMKAESKIIKMTHWAESKIRKKDVPDPFRKSLKEYQKSFDMIREGVDGLIAHLQEGQHQ